MIKDYPSYLDYPKPRKNPTNADHIRSMTDEELAGFLDGVFAFGADSAIWAENATSSREWLKKPFGEGS